MKPDESRAKKKVSLVPKMVQIKNESDARFLSRIGEAAKKAIECSQLEQKVCKKIVICCEY